MSPILPITLSIALSIAGVWPQAAHAATAASIYPNSSTAPLNNKSTAKSPSASAAKSSSRPEVQTQGPVLMAPALRLTAGKSMLLQLSENAERLSVGNPDVADVVLINPREIYLLGKKSGHTNLLVWTAQGSTTLRDISVGVMSSSSSGWPFRAICRRTLPLSPPDVMSGVRDSSDGVSGRRWLRSQSLEAHRL